MRDSTVETKKHIARVHELLSQCMLNLGRRGMDHDGSKLADPEKRAFDAITERLPASTYGSDEYNGFLAELKPALQHHYTHNPHHPEHYENGIAGMSLLDLLEMLADWKAASERHTDGSMSLSMAVGRKRFGIGEPLCSILANSAREMGWI